MTAALNCGGRRALFAPAVGVTQTKGTVMKNHTQKATVRCNGCDSDFDEDEVGLIFECPKCDTDAYLMDLGASTSDAETS